MLDEVLPALKEIDGVEKVNRIVCGGCMDFKVRKDNNTVGGVADSFS